MKPNNTKTRLCRLAAVILLAASLLVAGAAPVLADGGNDHIPPLDFNAIFKSRVPHANANISTNASPGGGGGSPTAVAFSGTPYAVGATVTPTTSSPEAEEFIEIDPNNALNMVAAISDFALRGGYNTTKYVVSSNGGSAWTEHYVPLNINFYPITSDGQSWEANSDPVVAIDRLGNVYLADLYFNASNNANGLYVGHGTLSTLISGGTLDRTNAVAVNLSATTNISEDKEWVAVDNTALASSSYVYVSWTHFVGNSDYIVLSRSIDHGLTWSPMLRISPTAQDGAVQGSQVAVGPNGEVYVAYEVFYAGGQRQQFLCKSTNGGLSFSAAVAITPLFSELKFNSTYRKNSFISLAVSPSGTIVGVYSDQSKKGGAEVEFIMSTTAGGMSFTSPVVINNVSSGQQFMPAVTVDASGVIHASWFDTRNSGSTSFYDIYATYTKNNGVTFANNARVTASTINAGRATFIGDYAGIAAAAGLAHPVWTSGGFNNGRLQTATLTLP